MIKGLEWYIQSMLGRPYQWGGNNPVEGMDCSGLCCELYRAIGLVGNKEDLSAQGLFEKFRDKSTWNVFQFGALAFYGQGIGKLTHVAFVLSPYLIVEAGGGGSATVSPEIASKQGAFVRLRPIKYRADFVCTLKPSLASMGIA